MFKDFKYTFRGNLAFLFYLEVLQLIASTTQEIVCTDTCERTMAPLTSLAVAVICTITDMGHETMMVVLKTLLIAS